MNIGEMQWKDFKDAVEAAGATDDTYIQEIRMISPGTPIRDLSITIDELGLTVD